MAADRRDYVANDCEHLADQGDRHAVTAPDLEQRSTGRTSRVSTAQMNRSDALPANVYGVDAAGRGEPPAGPANRASSRIGEGLKPLTIR